MTLNLPKKMILKEKKLFKEMMELYKKEAFCMDQDQKMAVYKNQIEKKIY